MLTFSLNYMRINKNPQKTGYLAYLRESVDLKSGIEIQREKINRYCKINDIVISRWFEENNASAMKPRNEYTKMMDLVLSENDESLGIICSSLSRYGRRTAEVLVDHDRLLSVGKNLILIDMPIDSTTAAGTMTLGNMAVYSQYERDIVVERMYAGKERAKIHGTKSGKPMHRPKIEIDWKEYDKYHGFGLSTNAISKIIKDKRTGKPISSGALYNAVKNRNTT